MLIIYKIYYKLYNSRKKIIKYLFLFSIIFSILKIIKSINNNENINVADFSFWLITFGYKFFAILFYKFVGVFWICKYNTFLTKEFQKKVMPKNIKACGKRRGFKDTIQVGMASNFVKCSKEKIKAEIKEMKPHLYRFDLVKIKKYIKENISIFNTGSKNEKKQNFDAAVTDNKLFLKEKYVDDYEAIYKDSKSTKKTLRTSNSKYIITDSVNFKHVVNLLYDYMYLIWRLEIDIWLIPNQPMFQEFDYKKKKIKTAKIFSPDLKSTKKREVKSKDSNGIKKNYQTEMRMLAEDYICFYETEADIWWSNITENAKKVIIDGGIRWFEAAQGHIMGENILNLRNGQVAGRTAKTQRDLEESFFSPSRAIIVKGGYKRIILINLFSLIASPIIAFLPRFKEKIINLKNKLKMGGWLKIETVFSRTESLNYNAPGVSLLKLLDENQPLYMSQYQVTLVFKIRDCWGKYNTHYLEYLADELTKECTVGLLDIPSWSDDLKLTKEHIKHMNYGTSDLFNLSEEEKYALNPHFIEKEK